MVLEAATGSARGLNGALMEPTNRAPWVQMRRQSKTAIIDGLLIKEKSWSSWGRQNVVLEHLDKSKCRARAAEDIEMSSLSRWRR